MLVKEHDGGPFPVDFLYSELRDMIVEGSLATFVRTSTGGDGGNTNTGTARKPSSSSSSSQKRRVSFGSNAKDRTDYLEGNYLFPNPSPPIITFSLTFPAIPLWRNHTIHWLFFICLSLHFYFSCPKICLCTPVAAASWSNCLDFHRWVATVKEVAAAIHPVPV